MRLVKIKLAPSIPFWFLGDSISLHAKNPISSVFDIDAIDQDLVKVIEVSANRFEIILLDVNDNRLNSVKDSNYLEGDYFVSTEDIKEEEKEDSSIFSITCPIEEEEEELVEEKPLEITKKDRENAKILLKKNGNTIKKTIKSMDRSEKNLALLSAMLEMEKISKNRKGIICSIEEVMNAS